MHELNFSASETLNMFRSLEMFLRWKNAVFVTWKICFSKDRLLSNITPRFFTIEEVTVPLYERKGRSRVRLVLVEMVVRVSS